MKLFNVYPLYDLTLTRGLGSKVFDDRGDEYLDLYGGHGVISVGHCHPHYVKAIQEQAETLGFYSNSVKNPIQKALADKLGNLSGCEDFDLFLCNSGAEANENALKLASFHTGRSKVIAFCKSFHGRTSAAVAVTDNPKINAPINRQHEVTLLPLNDTADLKKHLQKEDVAAVIIEGVQGVGGLDQGTTEFFQELELLCNRHGTVLILDEVQSGYGRTGKFFAFQHHGIQPDLVTVAKGMGNGFPVGGVLIGPDFKASYGLLGTTFGGNHLASAAALAVLEVLEREKLIQEVGELSHFITERIKDLPGVIRLKGRGLMLGLEFDREVSGIRKRLIFEKRVLTGGASDPNVLRILPPLNVSADELAYFAEALSGVVNSERKKSESGKT
jgi:acetylornithine aminotransferase